MKTLILGIGNVLWADEGFGVRAVESLQEQYDFPDGVSLMDGGTQGIYLVQHVQQAELLVVFDAIDYGLEPGTLRTVEDEQVPAFMGAKKMSLHQTGFQEVLATAQLLGGCPERMLLIGVQPVELEDFGGSLRPSVKAQIQPAIDIALAYLAQHGIKAQRRERPLTDDQRLAPASLDMHLYERDRPSEAAACRLGDARVLLSGYFEYSPDPNGPPAGDLSIDVDYRGKY